MTHSQPVGADELDSKTCQFYREVLTLLRDSSIPFLIGGAYALARYTGITRHTKDLDMFVLPEDSRRVLELFEQAGFRTELTFPHWLAKAYRDDDFIDVIFSSGNGICPVDAGWFEHAVEDQVLALPVRLCPAEEIIWSKAFIMERERYDGADVAHLLRAYGRHLDWQRLLARFDGDWRILLTHLVLFGFIYPSEQAQVPAWVMRDLLARLQAEIDNPVPAERFCQGTLLSRAQYLIDLEHWGYQDARLRPRGNMTSSEVETWTEGIKGDQSAQRGVPSLSDPIPPPC